MIRQFLTDGTISLPQNQGWNLRELTNVLCDIQPPNTFQGFNAMPVDWEGLGGFTLINKSKIQKIDNNLHNHLLEQSIQENGELWRRLAQR
ncbi:MAG: hypothetical protein WCE68_09875 [Anaerolineales bacterium]